MNVNPRGPLSAALLDLLSGTGTADVAQVEGLMRLARRRVEAGKDLAADEDVQLSLYLLYELHYSGNAVAADDDAAETGPAGAAEGGGQGTSSPAPEWEWDPGLLRVRQLLERAFEGQLRVTYGQVAPADLGEVPALLFAMARDDRAHGRSRATADPGSARRSTSIASYVARHASVDQVREILVLRSPYQLKEADPHSFAIPRLRGRAKAALVEVQADEYGGGRPERMHQELFARSMRSVGLDDRPNRYLDVVPAVVLASVNAVSMFALHRRLRGALCGQLAAFEMTSSLPAKRYVAGMQRLGLGEDAWLFFDEHVEADAVHEQIAANDLCGGLLDDEPGLAADVLLGASVCHGLDARVADHVLSAWTEERTALRRPLAPRVGPEAEEERPALHLLHDEASTADAGAARDGATRHEAPRDLPVRGDAAQAAG